MESNQQLLVGVLAGVGIALGATFLLGHRQQYAPPFNHHNPRSSSTDPSDRRQANLNLAELGDDDSAIRNGFSMREAKDHSSKKAQLSAQRTPEEVLHALQRGNTRFWMGVATRPEVSAFERRALIMRQHPSVAILGCADSRVPIEIVFDQGLGDVFTIRVAGNCMDTATEGTLEYAVCDTSSALSLSLIAHVGTTAWTAVATDNISQHVCVEHVGRRTHPSLLSFSLSLLINTVKLFLMVLISIPICIPICQRLYI
jgi:hypothetical protein